MSPALEAPVRHIPDVAPLPPLREPDDERRTLANGLDAWAAQRRGAGLSEVRLIVPLGDLPPGARSDAVARLVAALLLTEAAGPAAAGAGRRLAALGFSAQAGAGNGSFTVGLSGLDENLGDALTLVSDVLSSASFEPEEVRARAPRLAAQVKLEASDPGRIAHDRLRRILFPEHAYARTLIDPEVVIEVDAAAADNFANANLVPARSHLVVVSPREPTATLSEVEQAMGAWSRSGHAGPVPDPPNVVPAGLGEMLILDRPESVQTAFWFASRTSDRGAADYPALSIAVLVLQKRVYDNIRRRNAWSYAAGSQLMTLPRASYCLLGCPVRTEVTLPAYVELLHEMNRMVSAPITPDELAEAVGALQGRTAQRLGSRSGLVGELASLAEAGLTVRVLANETAALSSVTPEEVMEVSRKFLAPSQTAFVAVGSAEALVPLLGTIGPVRVASA